MKKIIFTISVLVVCALGVYAQKHTQEPFIEVTGKAELKIVPNEIFIYITLSEKDSKNKNSVKKQEKQLVIILKKIGIPVDNLSIADAESDLENGFFSKKIYNKKKYILKLNKVSNVGKLMQALKDEGISNVSLKNVDNSDIQKYKKEVAIMAVKNAKAKAAYLLSPLNKKVGDVIFIRERNTYYDRAMNSFRMSEMPMMDASSESPNRKSDYILSFREMTLTAEVFVKFLITK